jgi:hypothetical protein
MNVSTLAGARALCSWFRQPRLHSATVEQRTRWEIAGGG